MAVPPRLIVKDSAGYGGIWNEVHFDVWKSPGSAAEIRARYECQRILMKELPPERKLITVAVVTDEATKPLDDERRAVIDEGVKASMGRVKGAAIVIMASGFKAVIIRSVIAALTLLSGANYPSKTFDAVDAMFVWVATLLDVDGAIGRRPSAEELKQAYEELARMAASST
jgi:hypothetical protein